MSGERKRTGWMLALFGAAVVLGLGVADFSAAQDEAEAPATSQAEDPASKDDGTEKDTTANDTAPADSEQDAPGAGELEDELLTAEDLTADEAFAEVVTQSRPWYVNLGIFVAIVALMGVPFLIGGKLADRLRMPDHGWKIGLALGTILWAAVIDYVGWPPNLGPDLSGGVNLIYEVDPEVRDENVDLDQLIGALTLRVNPGGVKEVTIRPYGPRQVEIIIPKADETELQRIKKKIITAGALQFRMTANAQDHPRLIAAALAIPPDINEVNLNGDEARWVHLDLKQFAHLLVRQGQQESSWINEALQVPKDENIYQQGDVVQGYWLAIEPKYIPRQQRTNDLVMRRNADGELEFLLHPAHQMEPSFQPKSGFVLRTNQRGQPQVLIVSDPYRVEGGHLISSSAGVDEQMSPAVHFTFDSRGSQLFADLTTDYKPSADSGFRRRLGVVLDDALLSAPNLNEPIVGGRGQISGRFTEDEVKFLVSILNAGGLPNALNKDPISEQITGPQLGLDTIRMGATSMVISMSLVLVFMLFYYRFAGLLACLALLANLTLILAVMISIKAAFTLPGLAGLVLTVGMSVDANVLIFERIREEQNRGSALRMAIRNGFDRATTTIVDANVTTLITAIVLYAIGTDQIRGFAVTLILGIVMSMYTAIFCTRIVFDMAERRRWISEVKMAQLLGSTNIDFLGRKKFALAGSLLVIATGITAMVDRGHTILDIDFLGGSSVTLVFLESEEDVSIAEVRQAAEQAVRELEQEIPAAQEKLAEDMDRIKSEARTAVLQEQGAEELSESDRERRIRLRVQELIEAEHSRALIHTPIDVSVVGVGADTNEKQFKIDTSITDFEVARETLREAFGPRLKRNDMTFELESAESLESDEDTGGEREAAPEKDASLHEVDPPTRRSRSRKTLVAQGSGNKPLETRPKSSDFGYGVSPSGSGLRSLAGLTAFGLLQDESPADGQDSPAEVPVVEEGRPPEPKLPGAAKLPSTGSEAIAQKKAPADPGSADTGSAKPGSAEPSAKTAAEQAGKNGPTAATRETLRYKLTFTEDIQHDSLAGLVEEAFATAEIPPVTFEVDHKEHDAGSGIGRKEWFLTVALEPPAAEQVLTALETKVDSLPVIPSASNIGGKVAGDTQAQAGYALFASLLFIIGYIWFRFQQIMFGLAAVAALVHDVLITIGVIAISAYVAQIDAIAAPLLIDPFKISLPVVAAILTIIGYSLNDTIVVFDRIREVRGKSPDLTEAMVNTSINQTLSRTLLTSLTTLIVVVILYFGGGPGIHGFAFCLVIGVIVGTYSSIFVAAPVLVWMSKSDKESAARRAAPESIQAAG